MKRFSLPLVLALATSLAPGCGVSMMHVPRVAWTTSNEPTVLETVATIVRAHGYPVSDLDPVHGRFTFLASYHARPTENVTFVAQVYGDGHVDLTPSGPRVSPSGDGFQVPSGLWEEYRTLTNDITQQLHPSATAP